MKRTLLLIHVLLIAVFGGFAQGRKPPFQKVVASMEIEKFLGSWYVIALLPSPFEKNAVNGIETYTRDKNPALTGKRQAPILEVSRFCR